MSGRMKQAMKAVGKKRERREQSVHVRVLLILPL